VFETPRGRVLADMDIHGIEIGGERLIVSVITAVSGDAHPDESILGAILEATPLGVVLYVSFGSSVSTARSSGSAASAPSTSVCA
jgi:hypothetical protein